MAEVQSLSTILVRLQLVKGLTVITCTAHLEICNFGSAAKPFRDGERRRLWNEGLVTENTRLPRPYHAMLMMLEKCSVIIDPITFPITEESGANPVNCSLSVSNRSQGLARTECRYKVPLIHLSPCVLTGTF
jgi:hypothetical protein